MASKRYSVDLQERLEAEITSLQTQRALASAVVSADAGESEPAASAPAAGFGSAEPPITLHEPAPAAPAPPPSPAPPSVARARGRGSRRTVFFAAGGVALALALILGAIVTLATSPSNTSRVPTPTAGPQPTSTPGPLTPSAAPPFLFWLAGEPLLVLLFVVLVLYFVRRRRGPAPAGAESAKAPPGPEAVKALDLRLNRLEQLRTWMGEDPDLERLIDDASGKRVTAAERRQRYFSAGIGTATLIGGWLLSAISPPAGLLRLLLH